jgi:hypothetical protein
MTADEYRRVGHIFDEIRALPESAWRGALDEACAGNADLRAQVIVLLDADRQVSSGGFLERSALEDAAHLLNRNSTQLPSPGTVIGNYRVGQRIGAGGMGVVFEAHDLRLDRRVALKVLPPHIATEKQERLQRFKREARAAALLNHPNMVAIYDAEFEQGWCYIAMEFVEGKTLRQMITAQARPLDPTNVLDVIGQAAAALSAAHQADMVHRDVKPENIMVRDDGFVKLLDFGLAKLREPDSNPENGACLPTRPGNLAGTVHYVSPEQIQGKPAGAGSDLFSLGVVAYELAAGVRPFDGPTDGAVFNAILNTTPPLPSAARPVASRTALAAELDVLIMRLLEKDPELRFQTAQDVRSSCLRLSRAYIAAPPQAAPAAGAPAEMRSQTGHWKPLAAILGLATVLTAALLWLTRPLPMPRVTRIVQITRDGLPKEYFVNDGKRLYYASGNGNTQLRMFQVSARGGDPVPMRLPAGMVPFDISADGSELLLGQFPKESGASLTLWTAATLGGPPRRLGDLRAYDARWSPKGDEIVYCNPPEIRIASSDGSDSRLLTVVKGNDLRYPAWSPDGRLIRFTLDKKNVVSLWQVESDGTHLKELFRESGDYPRQQGVWTPDGKYFLFSAQQVTQDLWAVPQIPRFSLRRGSNLLRLTNGPLIADRPQPTPDGRRIFFRGRLDRGELVRYDEKADRWVPYLDGLAGMQLDYSRDGKWITYASYPDTSIWRCAADGSDRVQLTTPPLTHKSFSMAVQPASQPGCMLCRPRVAPSTY